VASAADEMAAALEQLACSIAREFKFVQFASLLFSFSEYKYSQLLFHKKVMRTVASATSHKLKALVSQPVIAELARQEWNGPHIFLLMWEFLFECYEFTLSHSCVRRH
jgi:hypothetical protein